MPTTTRAMPGSCFNTARSFQINSENGIDRAFIGRECNRSTLW